MAMVTGTASLFAVPWAALVVVILLVGGGIGWWQLVRFRQRRLQETVDAVADKVRRETEQRLLGSKDTSAGKPTGKS
jgi:cytoskeletal protein RodZ